MIQQIIALVVIIFFLIIIFKQKKQGKINAGEFIFWYIFCIGAGVVIIFLKLIDKLVTKIGFSGNGIEVLLYVSVVILFYIIFRLRLQVEKLDRDITKITRIISLNNKE